MCCQKLSDFITLNKCCCGIPLKMATYIAGGFMLMYSFFMEIDAIQTIYIHDTTQDEENVGISLKYSAIGFVTGAGVGVIDHVVRSQDGFEMTMEYIQNFMRGLLIAWTVINGFLIMSTCLMLYGNAKGNSILVLQWLVVIATIGIGNVADFIVGIVYISKTMQFVSHPFKPRLWGFFFVIEGATETGAILFSFLVVRSHYYRLTLPSIPVSFNSLKNQDYQNNTEEEEETVIKDSIVDI